MAQLIGHVPMEFNAMQLPGWVDGPVQVDLSAAVRVGDAMFLACDETAGIERLSQAGEVWADHRHYQIGAILGELPGEAEEEMDIEGLSVSGDWLWLTGSQSVKRRRPREDEPPDTGMKRLARTTFEEKRQFLGRLPLTDTGRGMEPVSKDGKRRAAHVKFAKGGKLRKWLDGDRWLDPFLAIPSKENGLDVEGLAVRGRRVWLGLRGPVLAGFSVVLELRMKVTGNGHLTARRIDGKRRYRLHLLPTEGDGVRDLAVAGDDLMVLVGTTGSNDGRSAVYRWREAFQRKKSGIVSTDDLSLVADLGYRGRLDNPEALTRWDEAHWLVVHDSPAQWRREGGTCGILADLWDIHQEA